MTVVVFLLVGIMGWYCAGMITGMASFRYTAKTSREMPQEEREQFDKFSRPGFKVGGVWALCGAATGRAVSDTCVSPGHEAWLPPAAACASICANSA